MSTTGVRSRIEDWLWRLIAKARSGDKQAAKDLISEPKIFKSTKAMAAGLRKGGFADDYKSTDDLHTDILLMIPQKITDFKGESMGEFWRWLWWRARGIQSGEQERLDKERRVLVKNGLENTDRPVTDSEAPYNRILLKELMQGLPALDKKIIELRVQGYTLEEIAEKTETAKTTVDRHLKQTLEDMRKKLGSGE